MTAAQPTTNLGAQNLWRVQRWCVRAVLILAFLVSGGAFSLQLSGLDPHAPVGADSASARSEIVIGLALGVMMLFGTTAWRRAIGLLRSTPLLLALPMLAVISALWAPDPVVSLRRAAAFVASVLAGVAVVAHAPKGEAPRVLAQVSAAAVLASLVYVMLRPDYGLHQLTDGVQNIHAGDWRGLFGHRTVLGQLSALALALAVFGRSGWYGSMAGRLAVAAAALVCLVKAHSGGGVASAAILLLTPAVLALTGRLKAHGGSVAAGLAACFLALAVLSAPLLTPLILQGLGKDATLTGRTTLWRLMLEMADRRPILGYGYSTGFRDVVAKAVAARSGFGYVPNAQNGYLDVTLNLGLVGLGLALATLGQGFWRAARSAWRGGGAAPVAVASLLILIFIAEMNGFEASLISANDIFMLIYAAALTACGELVGVEGSSPGRPIRRPALPEP